MTSNEAAESDTLVRRLRGAGCVFAEEEAALLRAAAPRPEQLERLAERRIGGEPLEHILGWVEFLGYRLVVGPGVFVPRARTGMLVREAVSALRWQRATRRGSARGPQVLVDLCCGCGAVGVAVVRSLEASSHGDASPVAVYAADVDPVAVAYAERNLAGLAGAASVGDLYEALPDELRGRVDVLVANAPYVPTDEIALMPPEARTHEPRTALDGGGDGLDVQRRIAAGASQWLAPGGRLLVETSRRQADASVALLLAAGLSEVGVVTDDEVAGTVAQGTRGST